MPGDLIAGDRHVVNPALVDLRDQFTEGDVSARRALTRLLEKHEERQHQQPDDPPESKRPEIFLHVKPDMETLPSRMIPGQRSIRLLSYMGMAGAFARQSR